MFKSPTLFIVGAGASSEVGLPTGISLKSTIAERLNITFEFMEHYPSTGDSVIAEALRHHVNTLDNQRQNINPHLYEAWKIRDAMPLASSIDTYLDAHRGNDKLALCGKLAITRSILDAEKSSRLFCDQSAQRQMIFSDLEQTWFTSFWRILTEGVDKSGIDTLFNNVAFISFNYDRCIEHYLLNAIRNYYVVDEVKAIELVNTLPIFHPYGTIGMLPGLNTSSFLVRYGDDIDNGSALLNVSTQIKTFTERIENEKALTYMRHLVDNAITVVFLGFAFHDQNMALLNAGHPTKVERVFATSYGMSPNDRSVVVKQITSTLGSQLKALYVHLGDNLTCTQLFQHYWRSLK